jgi:four helix bundle protein
MSLRIYGDVIHVLRALRPVVEQIETRDRDLGEQLRSALSSVALNTSEGGGSQKGNVRARYFNALGSIKESRACLDVAVAWAYIDVVDAKLADRMDHITAVLWRLTH